MRISTETYCSEKEIFLTSQKVWRASLPLKTWWYDGGYGTFIGDFVLAYEKDHISQKLADDVKKIRRKMCLLHTICLVLANVQSGCLKIIYFSSIWKNTKNYVAVCGSTSQIIMYTPHLVWYSELRLKKRMNRVTVVLEACFPKMNNNK